jgi:uncharacterized protein (TIGR03663 family)
VAIDSTKSNRKENQRRNPGDPAMRGTESSAVPDAELSERNWRIASVAILAVGAFLRLYDLRLVPLHHDEGVNGNFLVSLVRNGTYKYDPNNYHGPTLYYFSALIPWIYRLLGGKAFGDAHGLTTFNIRFVTAAFGIGTIGLVLLLRNRLGAIGSLSAAALIATSPGAVYLSRYFIHETLFVFFALGIVVAALKYYDSGQLLYLVLGSMSAALMCATKETWIMNGPVLLIALVTTNLYFWLRSKLATGRQRKSAPDPTLSDRAEALIYRLGGRSSVAAAAIFVPAVFVIVFILFYSSFLTNYPKGVHDALQTLNLWSHRTHEHEHPWWQYIEWLREEEILLLILGGVGALLALWRADNRLGLFTAQWAFGILAAYSLVGYKTPWIALNFIVPLAIAGGYALDVAYRKLREFGQPGVFALPAALIIAFCSYQMISLNFFHYDDDSYAYVYAHTRRGLLAMLDEIDRVAKHSGTGYETGITIVSPDYWPLPWYFRDYTRVGYYGGMAASTEPIIIGSKVQQEEIQSKFGDRYQLVQSGLQSDGSFALRPGVDLLLFVRRDVPR